MNDIASRTEEVTEDEQSIFGEANYNLTSKFKITKLLSAPPTTPRASGPVTWRAGGQRPA